MKLKKLIFAAQEQALRTNHVKFNRDKSVDSPLCRLCGQKGETINHIIGECKCLAQKEYTQRRHDNIARLAQWKLCCKVWLEQKAKDWIHGLTSWGLPLVRVAAENSLVRNSKDLKEGTGKMNEDN